MNREIIKYVLISMAVITVGVAVYYIYILNKEKK